MNTISFTSREAASRQQTTKLSFRAELADYSLPRSLLLALAEGETRRPAASRKLS